MSGVNLQNLNISSGANSGVSAVDLSLVQAKQGVSEFDLLLNTLLSPENDEPLLDEEGEEKGQQSFISPAEEETIANSFQNSSVSVILETKVFQNIRDVDSSILNKDKPFNANLDINLKEIYHVLGEQDEGTLFKPEGYIKTSEFLGDELKISSNDFKEVGIEDGVGITVRKDSLIEVKSNKLEKNGNENQPDNLELQADEIDESIDHEEIRGELREYKQLEGNSYELTENKTFENANSFIISPIFQAEKIIQKNNQQPHQIVLSSSKEEIQVIHNFEEESVVLSKNFLLSEEKKLPNALKINTDSYSVSSKNLDSEKDIDIDIDIGSFRSVLEKEIVTSSKSQNVEQKFNLSTENSNFEENLGDDNINKISLSLKSITKSNKKEIIKIELNPKDLGSLQIEFEKDKETGVSKITFSAEKFTTLDLLAKSTQEIQKIISDSGIKVDDSSLKFEMQNNSERNGSNNEYIEDKVVYQTSENKIPEYKTNYSVVISEDEVNIIA